MRVVRPLLARLLVVAALASLLPGSALAQLFTEFSPPTVGTPLTITVGPDGALWFTERDANKIGRVTTSGGFTEFTVPTAASMPFGIATGPDGALWFTEFASGANKIGRVTTGGVFTEWPIPTAASNPEGIALGPDGNLWFGEISANKIGRITPAGVITEFSLPNPGSVPRQPTAGPDGAVWFTEGMGRIGRILTGLPNTITEFTVPTANSVPWGIVTGPDGALWFTEVSGAKVGRLTTAGVFTEYNVHGTPFFIGVGPDRALYFGEGSADKLGRITTSGVYTEYTPPTAGSYPNQAIAGPDGTVWFTESGTGKIGRMLIDPARVANISTRAEVVANSNVMIAGIIIQGNTPQTVAITATGPSLAAWVPNPLGNPALTIVRMSDSATIASNDDWMTDAKAAQLLASGFAPSHPLEAGLLLTLPPGAYTAIVSGSGGTSGVSLVAVYTVP